MSTSGRPIMYRLWSSSNRFVSSFTFREWSSQACFIVFIKRSLSAGSESGRLKSWALGNPISSRGERREVVSLKSNRRVGGINNSDANANSQFLRPTTIITNIEGQQRVFNTTRDKGEISVTACPRIVNPVPGKNFYDLRHLREQVNTKSTASQ